MVENRDEQARYEVEEELLSPPQELLSIIEDIPQGTIDAYEINATNVANFQYIGQQVIVSDGTIPPNTIVPARMHKLVSPSKSPPFFLPQHDISFFTGREDEL